MSKDSEVTTKSGTSAAAPRAGNAEEAGSLIRGTVGELKQMLDAKHVIGEPMQFGGATVVPLVNVGFGFGAGSGGGGGKSPGGEQGEGGGGGGGGGGGVKPVAVLVIQDGRVTLEPIPEAPSGIDRLGGAIANVLDRRGGDSKDDD
jgi:uncharacterized spore protein YtfJ